MIPLHKPPYRGKEQEYIASAMANKPGQTSFCDLCTQWLEKQTGCHCLMTTSCSTALDMVAALLHAKPGDEVILPSFTFSSTANAFVRQGLVPVFVDIRKDTLNIDETKIEAAITERTVAIVVVHYAGVACEMDTICGIARRRGLVLIEDAAQALGATYRGKALGTFGEFACFSFHETKNFSMGEGGALLVRDATAFAEAEVMADCGTDRKKVRRKEAMEYTWIAKGASCIPSELACMFLYPQLLAAEKITRKRAELWTYYRKAFAELEADGKLTLPSVPADCTHNGHIFAIRLPGKEERDRLMRFLNEQGIGAAFHYIPLHSSKAGRQYGCFHGEDVVTTAQSERLLRLPLYYDMTQDEARQVADAVKEYFRKVLQVQ